MIAQNTYQYISTLVGFTQTVNECVPLLAPDLIAPSLSCNEVSGANRYLNNDFVFSAISDFSDEATLNVPNWNIGTSYSVGQRVKFQIGSVIYVFYSLQGANLGNTPSFVSDFWESDLSNYYRKAITNTANEVFNEVFSEINANSKGKDTLSYVPIFKNVSAPLLVERTDSFRCIQMFLRTQRNLNIKFTQIGIYSPTAQTIPFYVYHSSSQAALGTFNVVIAPSDVNKFIWVDVPNSPILQFGEGTDVGGCFLIGYYEDDLTMGLFGWRYIFADYIARNGVVSNATLLSTDLLNKPLLPTLGEWFSAPVWNDMLTFNVRVNSFLDYTSNVKNAPQMFAKVLQYGTAIRILNDIRHSARLNRNKSEFDKFFEEFMQDTFLQTQNGGLQRAGKGLLSQFIDLKENLKNNNRYLGGSPYTNIYG